jgi:hypothetical protein
MGSEGEKRSREEKGTAKSGDEHGRIVGISILLVKGCEEGFRVHLLREAALLQTSRHMEASPCDEIHPMRAVIPVRVAG